MPGPSILPFTEVGQVQGWTELTFLAFSGDCVTFLTAMKRPFITMMAEAYIYLVLGEFHSQGMYS